MTVRTQLRENLHNIDLCHKMTRYGYSARQIAELIDRSVRTVYRWRREIRIKGIRKFRREYDKNLRNRGRSGPSEVLKTKIWQTRKEYRDCCGEKIWYLLGYPCSVSTIYRILREGFQLKGKQKRPQYRGPLRKGRYPREAVQVDAVDLGELYAFTAIDTYTREAHVSIQTSCDSRASIAALRELNEAFGFIEHLQKDGGAEFGDDWETVAYSLGAELRTSAPYQKNEQAFIERFNRSLREECLGKVKYRIEQLREVQKRADDFVRYYHYHRPHLSLNFATPSEFRQ